MSFISIETHRHYAYKDWFILSALCCITATALFIPFSTALTNIFSISAFVFWGLGANVKADIRLALRQKYLVALLLFLVCVIGSALWNQGTWHSYFDELRCYRRFLFFIVVYLLLQNRPAWQEFTLLAFFGSTSLLAILAVGQYIGILVPWKAGEAVLSKGHITQGFLLSCQMTIAMGYIAFSHNIWWKVFCGIVALLAFVITVFLSDGRTGYVCIATVFIVTTLFWGRNHKKLLLLLLVSCSLAIVLIFSSSRVQNGIQRVQEDIATFHKGNMNSSIGLRIYFWKTSYNIVRDNPILGVGCGAIKSVSERYAADKNKKIYSFLIVNPHQDYLYILTQYGLCGFIFWTAFFYFLLKETRRCSDRNYWLLLSIIFSYLAGGLFNSFSRDITECSTFVLLIPLLLDQIQNLQHHNNLQHEETLES